MSPEKQYRLQGFFIVKKFFNKNLLEHAYEEILKANNVDKYFDQENKIRRIERIYDKGEYLKKINFLLLGTLKENFNTDFEIFKDKFNAKPPGGEGFYCHYDGVFEFLDKNDQKQPGWYKYTDFFINVLIAIDRCNIENGTIEISKSHRGTFHDLLENTKKNGTPDLKREIENKLDFQPMILEPGDIVFFSNTCPHRSKKNKSNFNRRTLYYTYSKKSKNNISLYNQYFKDKKESKNKTSKSLRGEI